ncbi:MAG: hypothetical protein IKH37_03800 [Prevotella sp.]|nr:hypothetical protein [Prevotella sp.]
MKKKFFSVASIACAAVIAGLGFGSCKTGKLAARERAALGQRVDSLNGRLSELMFQISEMHAHLEAVKQQTMLTMYGGPNMTQEERERMMRAVREKEEAARKEAQAIEGRIAELQNEEASTRAKLEDTLIVLGSRR